MVLMHVHAFNLCLYSVDQQAFMSIENDLADTCRRSVFIDNPSVAFHSCLYIIYIGGRGTPQMGIIECQRLHTFGVVFRPHRQGFITAFGHDVAVGIHQGLADGALNVVQRAVVDLCFDHDNSLVVRLADIGMDEGTVVGNCHWSPLVEPRITVDAGSLVEPALLHRRVGTHADGIVATVIGVVGDVINLRGITTGFRSHIHTVEPHLRSTEDAVETQREPLAEVGLVDVEGLAVPPHTRSRILIAHGLIAMRLARAAVVGQRCHPVVGQSDSFPTAVVELRRVGSGIVDGIGFGEIIEILGAAAEVFRCVAGIAESKFPAVVQANGLPDALATGCRYRQKQKKEENYFFHLGEKFYWFTFSESLVA